MEVDGTGDAYRVLQVDPAADSVVIQAAYRALARRYHADGDAPDNRRMSAINAAYAILRDPERRRRHDVQRSMTSGQPVEMSAAQSRVNAWVPRREERNGQVILDFGRYAGWRIADLARHDPDYLRWLCRHSSGLRFRDAIVRVLPAEPDLERRANSVA